MQILLVDDDLESCEVFTEFFFLIGHSVTPTHSAYQALACIETVHYDAIIVDILLPDLDGYSLAQRIRRHSAFQNRPRIIAISALPFDRYHPHSADADFDAYLLKPVNLEVVEAALSRSTARTSA